MINIFRNFFNNNTLNAHEPDERYKYIMAMAEDIAKQNPLALGTLVSALLRPIQAEHMIALAEVKQHKAPNSISSNSFFFDVFPVFNLSQYWLKPTPPLRIDLNRDVVLPTCWDRQRYSSALSNIGTNKNLGPWQQDDNHCISVWLPWKISFVTGGNHSITSGILSGEGSMMANEVLDLTPIFDFIKCDGFVYKDLRSQQIIGIVTDPRKAAVFEIGRMMKQYNIP